ncbi:hypothetical protein D3C73_890960 [compost metagenome]
MDGTIIEQYMVFSLFYFTHTKGCRFFMSVAVFVVGGIQLTIYTIEVWVKLIPQFDMLT